MFLYVSWSYQPSELYFLLLDIRKRLRQYNIKLYMFFQQKNKPTLKKETDTVVYHTKDSIFSTKIRKKRSNSGQEQKNKTILYYFFHCLYKKKQIYFFSSFIFSSFDFNNLHGPLINNQSSDSKRYRNSTLGGNQIIGFAIITCGEAVGIANGTWFMFRSRPHHRLFGELLNDKITLFFYFFFSFSIIFNS